MVNVLRVGLVFALVFASVVGTSLPAEAFDLDALRSRLDQRRAELGISQQVPIPPAVNNPNNSNTNDETDETVPVSPVCNTSLNFSRAEVGWSGNQLVFMPRGDVSIRARGDDPSDSWQLNLALTGHAAFAGEGVPTPSDVSFSGNKQWSGPGGSSRFRFSGQSLLQEPVVLATIPRSEFGEDDELTGTIVLEAHLTGCDVDTERRQFTFEAKEFGNLRVRGWRSAR